MTRSGESWAGLTPPVWAGRFRSDDIDEVREAVARVDGEHSRVAHGTGPLGFEVAWLMNDLVSVAWARAALPTTLRGALPNVVLHVSMPAGSRYSFGRRQYTSGPNDVLFIADGWPFTRHAPPGTALALDINKEALVREVAALGPRSPETMTLTTQRLAMDPAGRTRLLSALAALVQATAPGAPLEAARHCGSRVLSEIADLLMEQSAVARARRIRSTRVAGLENWIEANLDQPITAGRLCRFAGVSRRGLEKIFESRHGMSPMRFVTERRLAAAQRMLVAAAPGDDVTRIALGLGFNHIGRFSVLYRQTYGESPSQTLRRSRLRFG